MARSILSVDLDAIVANWRALDALTAATTTTAAVVKADAYGLGLGPVARRLAAAGVREFCVAIAEEGAELRQILGPGPQISIFAGHMPGDAEMISDLALTPMLNSLDQITRHVDTLPDIPFGIQIDTGMNRLGVEAAEWAAVRDVIMQLNPVQVMSHLACADEPGHEMNPRQLANFRDMTAGLDTRLSFSATAGILLGPEYHFDITRPGVGLYGAQPFTDATPVINLTCPVIQTRSVPEGAPVGYGNSWIAKRPSRIATVNAGYADGMFRQLQAGGLTLMAEGIPVPLAGRISMDMLAVDVTDLPNTPDMIDILTPEQGPDAVADAAGTIGYEIMTALGQRYERRYRGHGG